MNSVQSHYDDLDEFYQEIWGVHVHHGLWRSPNLSIREATDDLVAHAVEKLQLKPGSKICDIGCGYGETARMLASTYGFEVTGFTISKKQWEYAQAMNPDGYEKNPRIYLQDWLQNEESSESFDGALSMEGMELHTIDRFSNEFKRTGFSFCSYEDLTSVVKRSWIEVQKRTLSKFFTDSKYSRFVFLTRNRNRTFLKSIFRVPIAYRSGALQYGVFVVEKN